MSRTSMKFEGAFGNANTGGAWLSSARVVRCWVKSRNERPSSLVAIIKLGTLGRLPVTNRRKVRTTSSQHAPYALGDTRTTMVGTKGSDPARESESHQTQPQFRLQAATRLHEVGIASNRRSAYCGEFVPGPCTHRPSHHGSWLRPK